MSPSMYIICIQHSSSNGNIAFWQLLIWLKCSDNLERPMACFLTVKVQKQQRLKNQNAYTYIEYPATFPHSFTHINKYKNHFKIV